MLKIPPQILLLYDEFLAKTVVPERFHFFYKKWLRYYLDFCHKYRFEPSKKESLSNFSNKLKDKNQNQDQRKQATHAVTIFYEIRRPHSEKEDGVKKETRKNNEPQPQKTTEKLLRNADWTLVYNDLDAEIKIRYYSPKTLKAYRGWVRQFQNFSRSKDPQLVSNADIKEFLTFLAVERTVSASSQNQAFNPLLFISRVAGAQRCTNHHDLYPHPSRARPSKRPKALSISDSSFNCSLIQKS